MVSFLAAEALGAEAGVLASAVSGRVTLGLLRKNGGM